MGARVRVRVSPNPVCSIDKRRLCLQKTALPTKDGSADKRRLCRQKTASNIGGREGLQPQSQLQAASCKQAPIEESGARKRDTGGSEKEAEGRRRQNTKSQAQARQNMELHGTCRSAPAMPAG